MASPSRPTEGSTPPGSPDPPSPPSGPRASSSGTPDLSGVPSLSPSDAAALAADTWGIHARAVELPGERDRNFLLLGDSDRHFVLKISNLHERPEWLEAESAVLRHLAPLGLCPTLVPTLEGGDSARVGGHLGARPGAHAAARGEAHPEAHAEAHAEPPSPPHLARVLTLLPGETLGSVRYQGEGLRRDVGRALGRVGRELASFDHPAVHRAFQWDLARAGAVVAEHLPLVGDPVLRETIEALASRHEAQVVPRLPGLRHRVIHGDANDYNLLVDAAAQVVTGIIDFGDMVYSHAVNDVAIAAAYVALGAPDPLGAAASVVAGYHEVDPLLPEELEVLWSLLCMRLCTSACLAVRQQAERPDDPYLGISQGPIRETLPRLLRVHPRFAHYTFREACGLPPVPQTPAIVRWLSENADAVSPLLGVDLATVPVAPLDMSVGSPLISSVDSENGPHELDQRVRRILSEEGARLGAGGYGEARQFYRWLSGPTSPGSRTLHMGLDLSVEAGTSLYAPLDGVVHAFEDAARRHDYGPLIVLRHEIPGPEPLTFHTLYGHLSRDSLEGLHLGMPVPRGTLFARVGSAPTNGDWWEHVHVQLITDMLDVPCNVDGAVRADQRRVWEGVFPDPNLLLRIPPEGLPRPVTPEAVATSRARHFGGNLRLSYGEKPVHLVRGLGPHLWDASGQRYVDAYNNVAHVGHSHPRVVQAVSRQLALLNTNTRYLQAQLTEYAEALMALLPAPLEVCFFTTSGSEANELALRLARAATGARDLVVMEAAYHGHTTTLIDISPYKHDGPGGTGAPDWVHTSPIPDVYRTPGIEGPAGPWFAERVGAVVDRVAASGRKLAGYIAETCPSVGGQILPPEGFLEGVYRRVRAAGGVCIADEVQTGFGRLGTHFWAFEAQGVVPDIVVLGKPMANGYPMGGVVTTRKIAERFDNGMEFFSTFGGSTAACVAGLATLRVTLEEGLQANALRVGERLLEGLRPLAERFPLAGDVRGSGLFLGVELVRDRETRTPAPEAAAFVVRRMRDRGVLVGTDGPHHSVIKIRGPMPLGPDDADRIVETLALSLDEVPRSYGKGHDPASPWP